MYKWTLSFDEMRIIYSNSFNDGIDFASGSVKAVEEEISCQLFFSKLTIFYT